MGEVWLATDSLLDRQVALKFLRAPANPVHREQFLAEARILAKFNHPNITAIYDAFVNEAEAQFCLVVE